MRPSAIRQTRQISKILTSATTYREFMFSRMQLTGMSALGQPKTQPFPGINFLVCIDDDTFLGTNIEDLGDISVSVWEGTCGESITG
jgi:hypothetical protein